MVSVVPPLLVLLVLLCGSSLTVYADELNYIAVAMSSLKAKAVCSGIKVDSHANLTTSSWLPLSHPHGPCSTAAAAGSAPSVNETLLWDQHRAAYIHRKLTGDFPQAEQVLKKAKCDETRVDGSPTLQAGVGGSAPTKEQDSQMSIDPAATQLPGVVQTMVIDTSSDVAWVQCAPCPIPQCHPQTDVLYDPARSPTSAPFPCTSPTCTQLGPYANGCTSNNQCQYRVQYPGGSSSTGTYISDRLSLTPTGAGLSSFKFGCSHAVRGSFSQKTAGIMALGRGAQSLASQAKATYGHVFSYCLPPTASKRGFFILGVPGVSSSRYAVTPMLRSNQAPALYLVRLVAITVAGQRLAVPPAVFAAGAVMDSRTIITRLPPTAYMALRAAFRDKMRAYRAAAPKAQLDTCYDLRGVRTVRLPRIALVFDRNADVELHPSGILFDSCLAFAPGSDDRATGIIGNVQQQTIEVLYNVGGSSVGFRRGAC